MFEKFTEKAINVVTEAQEQARLMHNVYVQPEHLLLGIIKNAKGISLKLFRMYNVKFEDIQKEVDNKLRFEKQEKEEKIIPFGDDLKKVLKNTLDFANKSGNNYVLFEHLFITVITDKMSYCPIVLEKHKFDIENAVRILTKVVQKKTKVLHPELDDVKSQDESGFNPATFFEDDGAIEIFEASMKKLDNSKYEILGTEQIISSILDSKNTEVSQILEVNGITSEKFTEILSEINSRESEYEKNKIVFTPSAYALMDTASQVAKELGSPVIKPEHLILGLLQTKRGVAYDIFKKLKVLESDLSEEILKPIEKQMPQALTILRLARQEARRLGRNIVGTEMILLGIINEGTGVGFKVLNDLEITLKDARLVIENLIGYGNEYYDTEMIFTQRAKHVLEVAWQKAKKYKCPRILSEHLLYAITAEPTSVAMRALEQLGVDAVEIRQGILKEIEQ